MGERIHGLMAEFQEGEALLRAARRAYAEGYRAMDAYSPFPIDGLARALGRNASPIPLLMLAGGILGGLGAYAMQYYAMAVDYPLNVGGRPLHSWPSFIPVTFELTVLIAALSGAAGLLWLCRLPRPHHPVFNTPGFERASTDRFFLCIERQDPKFDRTRTTDFLKTLEPIRIVEVPQ